MPATISSCLNSCGLCGRAYQLPGWSRAGTRKSRAPSGVERVRVGVSTSTKPWRVEHVAGGLVDLAAQPERGVGAAATQVEVAVPQPGLLAHRRSMWSSIGNGSGALALSTSTLASAIDLDLAGGQVGVRVALGAQRRPRR